MRRHSGKINIVDWTYHNGVCGAPFYAVLFDDTEEETRARLEFFFRNASTAPSSTCASSQSATSPSA
jgi:hypothetical protein